MKHFNNNHLKTELRKVSRLLMMICLVYSSQYIYAQDLDDDNDGIPNSYEKGMGNGQLDHIFSQGTDQDNAVLISNNEIQLTQDNTSLRGSAMSIGKIDFYYDFTFSVEAYFGIHNGLDGGNTGADGIAMVFHNDPDGSRAIGDDGEGIGAQGIENGIVLEIDTYGNGSTASNDPLPGTDDDHTDIWVSDDDTRTSLIGGYVLYNNNGDIELEDGEYHNVVFTWSANIGTLSFTVDGQNAGMISAGSASNFINTYFAGSNTVHFGLTASTGGLKNEHKVRFGNVDSLPLVLDTDGDGIYDHIDLDSDNDGIYDAEESGHNAPYTNGIVDGGDANGDGIPDAVQSSPGTINYSLLDTDGDGEYNSRDIDSDGDGCFDVTEALFSDSDGDGTLGLGNPVVDANGLVMGVADGYSDPSNDYMNQSINNCAPIVDLGDAGSGFDRFVTYIEDSPAISLVDFAAITDMNNTTVQNMQITVFDIQDGNDEVLIIGGIEFKLNTSLSGSIYVNNETVRVTYTGNVFAFAAVGEGQRLEIETLEEVIEGMRYVHNDTIQPTDEDRILSIVVSDGFEASVPSTITINVDPVNDAPYADDESFAVNEGASLRMNLADGDIDIDGFIDLESILIVTEPNYGTVVVNPDGTVNYSHSGLSVTSDTFNYIISDNEGVFSDTATVDITIDLVQNEGNRSPIADHDELAVDKGAGGIVNVAEGDLDFDGSIDLGSIVIVDWPEYGTITVTTNGFVYYVHNGSETSADSFAYIINDNEGATSNVAIVDVTINEIDVIENLSPIADNDQLTVDKGESGTVNIAEGDIDPDGSIDLASIVILDWPQNGTLTISSNGYVDYIHDGLESTSDTFTYAIADDRGAVSNTATVNIAINVVDEIQNLAPTADDDLLILDEGSSENVNVADGDIDPDGSIDLASIVIIDWPQNGTLTINSNGNVGYVHDGSETTSDSFTYTIADNEGTVSNTATVNIIINPVDDVQNIPPVADNDLAFVSKDGTTAIDVLSGDNDPDGSLDFGSIVIVSPPAHGVLVINQDGTITYTHNGSDAVGDEFTYMVRDDAGANSNVAQVTIEINQMNVNAAPEAADDELTINNQDPILTNAQNGLLVNDFDEDGDLLSLVTFTIRGVEYWPGETVSLQEGDLTIYDDGSYVFTPAPDFTNTSLEIEYTISDGELSDVAIFNISSRITTGSEELETSMIVTNNGDNRNDSFVIQGIESFPNNYVIIFNRWGNKVWEINGYVNGDITKSFSGYPNLAGSSAIMLPDGTYYFVIDKGEGSPAKKGFVVLR